MLSRRGELYISCASDRSFLHWSLTFALLPCLDKLFDIVRDWQPGKYSKVFLCHLVELVHTTLKTLEWYKKHGPNHIAGVNMDTTARNGPSKNTYDKEVMDRVNAARSFDLGRYFERLTSNQ